MATEGITDDPGQAEPAEPRSRYEDLDDEPANADERRLLLSLYDWQRAGVVAKVAGLTDAQARQRHVASASTIAGLVKHLALVEDAWFTERFAGQPLPEPWAGVDFDADPDWEFRTACEQPLAEVVALYEAACERSRAVVAGASLDDEIIGQRRQEPFSLRWMLLHMIDETARHLGHLDILRELTDGATGV